MNDLICLVCRHLVHQGPGLPPAPKYCPRCAAYAQRSVRLVAHPGWVLSATMRVTDSRSAARQSQATIIPRHRDRPNRLSGRAGRTAIVLSRELPG